MASAAIAAAPIAIARRADVDRRGGAMAVDARAAVNPGPVAMGLRARRRARPASTIDTGGISCTLI